MDNDKLTKIILLIIVIAFIIISCSKKPALKSIEADEILIENGEVLIDISYADEDFFKKYTDYDSFIENEEYAHKIAFIPNVPVKDFSWLSISIDYDDNDEIVWDIGEELYSLKELHPQKPLVVSWVEVGIMSVFGFSYRDKDGQKKYFMGGVGNYGGDPEEYDGPAFWNTQFFPKTILAGQYYTIHKNVPDLLFREIGYKNGDDIVFKELVIVNSETKKAINKINLLDYTFDGEPPASSGEALDIEFIDVNFDGYKDIRILDSSTRSWNELYLYFVWDRSNNLFVPDTQGLGDLGLPKFDEEKQLISSLGKSGATDHWFYTHKYINGILTVIEETSEIEVLSDDDKLLASIVPVLSKYPSYRFMRYVVKKINYNTSELETVESKYQLYDADETLIDEYDANSDTGRQLEKLFYGQ